ncbi:hypothetical protein [Ulvibacter antarcticus]|uniref:Uncharacterized protein n=1 Tax=Ulvibacter antarcticus TaxID=442714 RepID=A0A3L9YBC0_9FLAO|nr:hypothetical protein [Ulvibacter antarcticus]RMA58023.1 hypothetical protein BXY75_2831 [Ulvibacter antarcticus]
MGLQLAYIGLSIIMFLIILRIGFTAINGAFGKTPKAHKKKLLLVILLLLWQVYVIGIAATGILQNFDLPPRFFIFLILPAFTFTGIFIYKNRNNSWIHHIPKSWLVYYQSFRIFIESIFVWTVAMGILTPIVTVKGYNYDMIFAFTAPVLAVLVFKMNVLPEKFLIFWNYLGLVVIAVIIFLFLSSVYAPHLYGSDVPLLSTDFIVYPYVLVPAFLMPSAVFIHVLSIVQLTKSRKNEG